MPHRRTGLPDIDALIEVQEREQAKLDEHFVLSKAEGTIANRPRLGGNRRAVLPRRH